MGSSDPLELANLRAALSPYVIHPLTEREAEQLAAYARLLLRWNARTNLTAVRSPAQIVQRHFGESLFLADRLPASTSRLLDFGSGAGFPGLPIALRRPEIQVKLAESQSKKAAFLREVVRTLRTANVQVHAGRAEALPGGFDAVSMRAVDRMREMIDAALALLRPGGTLALLIGADEAAKLAGSALPLEWDAPHEIPGSEHRVLLLGEYFLP